MATTADVQNYKLNLLQAAAENNVGPLRPFLESTGLQWEDVRNAEKQHVLHVAALEGADAAVELMLSYNRVAKRVNSRDRASRTALHLASAMGYGPVVRRLASARAAVDMQDEKGCTPLHLAVKFEWSDTIRTLLELGADPMVEDLQGNNALDLANDKQDGQISVLMAGFAGHRRPQPTAMQQLHRCVFPRWGRKPRGGREPNVGNPQEDENPEEDENEDMGCGVGDLESSPASGPEPEKLGASYKNKGAEPPAKGATPANQLCSALAEAQAVAGAAAAEEGDGTVIEWHGLEPVLVKKDPQRQAPSQQAQRPGAGNPAAGASTTDDIAGKGGWWKQAVADHLGTAASTDARHRSSSAPPAQDPEPQQTTTAAAAAWSGAGNRGRGVEREQVSASEQSPTARASVEFAIFRLHMYFDEQVKRLEFEVEWKDEQPSSGSVKPGGEAARRGMHRGDRIVAIGSKRTSGKGRDELLPALKQRPLTLKVDREARVAGSQEPHIELDLSLAGTGFDDHGVDFAWQGQLPVATSVRPQSKAWAAGMLPGDALVAVAGKDVSRASKAALASLLEGNLQEVTIWRRPLGMDLSSPWTAGVSE